jgi:hypothetical protein
VDRVVNSIWLLWLVWRIEPFFLAAFSLAFKFEVLVQLAEFFIPDSFLLTFWNPHHTVKGEDTNTSQLTSEFFFDCI